MSVVISARKVSKVYQARSGDVAALKNFSYDFEAGLFLHHRWSKRIREIDITPYPGGTGPAYERRCAF